MNSKVPILSLLFILISCDGGWEWKLNEILMKYGSYKYCKVALESDCYTGQCVASLKDVTSELIINIKHRVTRGVIINKLSAHGLITNQ